MKFRNPETGKVFDDIIFARKPFCKNYICPNCPLPNLLREDLLPEDARNCADFCKKHPREAAALMGYEVVEDEPSGNSGQLKEDNMDKPRICEVLGVEVNERVYYKDPSGVTLEFFISPDGNPGFAFENGKHPSQFGIGYAIAQAINHPDRIIRKPRWTEQEVEDARAIKRLLNVEVPTEIERDKDGQIYLRNMKNLFGVGLNKDLFPSIKTGRSIPLDEIIGGKT